MNELATSLLLFCDDLKQKGIFDRVVVMTFSEFGRRVHENANSGTDHGTAAPCLFVATSSRVCTVNNLNSTISMQKI